MKTFWTREILQASIASLLAITLFVSVFDGVTQLALAAEMKQNHFVATSYANLSPALSIPLPDDYVQPINEVSVDEKTTVSIDATAMSAVEAAAIGVRDLGRVFNTDFSQVKVQMDYWPASKYEIHAKWAGRIHMANDILYYFNVDAVTGEPFVSAREISLPASVNLDPDWSLTTNCEPYIALAREDAERLNLLSGEISEVAYYVQGYVGNNPNIIIYVRSFLGEETRLTYSRFDQTLLGVCYDTWVRETMVLEAAIEQEAQEAFIKSQLQDATNSSGKFSDESQLIEQPLAGISRSILR